MKPSLIVHGGAWDIPDEAVDACKEGCLEALGEGWKILASGGSSLDAVEAASNCSRKRACLRRRLRLSSQRRKARSNVTPSSWTSHAPLRRRSRPSTREEPIRAAALFMKNCPHMMLIAEGAEISLGEKGVPLCKPEELVSEAEWEAYLPLQSGRTRRRASSRPRARETVGAVAARQRRPPFRRHFHRRHMLPNFPAASAIRRSSAAVATLTQLRAGVLLHRLWAKPSWKIVMASLPWSYLDIPSRKTRQTPRRQITLHKLPSAFSPNVVAALVASSSSIAIGNPAFAFNTPPHGLRLRRSRRLLFSPRLNSTLHK